MVQLLEMVDRPTSLGFQADMAHTLLYTLGYNAPEDRILPENWNWNDPAKLDAALKTLTAALRPWTIDFHVAQNDATVKGSGSHDKTGRHCLPDDPNGKLDIAHHAGFWLRDEKRNLTKKFRHICWDGCMFPNDVMMKPETWNEISGRTMIAVREAHGWTMDAANGDHETAQYRHDRLRLHGPGAFQRATRRVNHFFDLEYRHRVLKAACGRDAAKTKAFADQWGYESVETRLAEADRAQGYRRDRYLHAEQHARRDRDRRGRGRAR